MEIVPITSRRSPVVRAAAALSSAKERRERGAFLCEGARLCQDAVLSGIPVEACFFTPDAQKKYASYLDLILPAAKDVYQVEPPVAQLLASTKSPQGIFCVCARPASLGQVIGFAPRRPCLVLENLQDPGNLGTILRTAEALGQFQVFLLGDCCDPLSPKALRASMGAVFRLALSEQPSAPFLFDLLHRQGYTCHAAVPQPAAGDVTQIDFTRGLHAVFIGNEGSGLSPAVQALCDGPITIPMLGRAESLNAAAAATVLLWEMCRTPRKGMCYD